MNTENLTKTQKLAVSGMVTALYLAVLYATQSISFGPVQIRIATALYALAYPCPFLILPLGLANLLSNLLFGGLGVLDMAGGFFVGIATTWLIAQVRRKGLSPWLTGLPILLVPGLCVPMWLSYLLHLPYLPLAASVVAGQAVPAVCGAALVRLWNHYSLGRRVMA